MRSNGGGCELRLNGQHGQWLRAGGKNKRFALWLGCSLRLSGSSNSWSAVPSCCCRLAPRVGAHAIGKSADGTACVAQFLLNARNVVALTLGPFSCRRCVRWR